MGKDDNIYIIKARKKRMRKKAIFIIVVILIILGLFITKSNFFLINNIKITGNNVIPIEDIENKINNYKGKNILFVKSDDIERSLKEEPYVDTVKIKRVYPKTLNITIEEKNVAFYVKKDKENDILSSDLVLLEKKDKIDNKNLIEIVGLKEDKNILGQKVIDDSEDTRLDTLCKMLYDIKRVNSSSHKITKVNVSNMNNIILYFNNVEVKIGNGKDIVSKVNTALNILEGRPGFKEGYIDVSTDGLKVINEKVKEDKK